MSQVRRQEGDDGQHHLLKLPLSSPPRNQMPSHPSLTGNLIPRDYLGPRSDGQTSRTGVVAATASPRKPAPSPLHTSFRPQSPRRDSPDFSQSPLSPRSFARISPYQSQHQSGRIGQPGFPVPPTSSNQTSFSRSDSAQKELLDGHTQHVTVMSEKPIYKESRKGSDTADSNISATSSPISPGSSQQSMPGDPSGQRVMPRTSSIDSAISSLSSVSHSHKSSFDANALSPADINNLISAAGSAEAVIVHLLKEKHHAASQNSQLWRLVDKQRTLILGLNKDLERALKEKEKYKKKIKEFQSSAPTLPTSESLGQRSAPDAKITVDASLQSLSNAMHSTSDAIENSPSLINAEKLVQRSDPQISESQMPAAHEPPSALPDYATASSSTALGLTSIEDKRDKIPHPSRKPPPAPLNLEQTERPITNNSTYDSESEYEDILEVDELIDLERGRRKTREEDEREREAAMVMEQETRNLSKKKNPKHLKASENPAESHELVGPTVLPSSPRQIVTGSPPLLEHSGSLASVLSPQIQHVTSVADRPVVSSPKSPGLPLSPRPGDRPIGSPLPRNPRDFANSLASPPMSAGSHVPGLPLSPRSAKFQIPPSQGTPAHLLIKANGSLPTPISIDAANRPIPSIDAAVKIDSPKSPHIAHSSIYQGLVSDDHPNLLLPPNALPLIQVKVFSSRLRPSRNSYLGPKPSDEEPVFTLSVFSRSEHRELWRVEKIIATLPQLDQQIRQWCNFTGRLPDRSIFSGHSPAKVDARRAALNSYFDTLLDTPMDERAALVICQFLTSDAIEPRDDETILLKNNGPTRPELLRGPDGKPRKEGYLTKRGKNFGGWKARYFVLHGPELKYFESPGGPHLGTIKLHNSQIGKQSQNSNLQSNSPSRAEDDSDNQYRHAFLILEPKKKDSSALVRHVLCAESDEERDAWVEALLEHVEGPSSDNEGSNGTSSKPQPQAQGKQALNGKAKLFPNGTKRSGKGIDSPELDVPDTVQGFSYDDAVPAEPPVLGTSTDTPIFKPSQTPLGSTMESTDAIQHQQSSLEQGQLTSHPSKLISGPTNGAVIQDAGAWGNKAATTTKEKKRSIWGFRTRSSFDLASQVQAHHEAPAAYGHSSAVTDRRDPIRPVFGIPLTEAVQYCGPQGVDVDLPAVVYRCIEYLEAKGAASEEGIFRLSGSNVVVKALKERFNTEGDVDFLAGDQYYDVHAVASLFKQYLRELPTTVLTRELHLDFLRVLELEERPKKIVAFNALVHRLPKANLTLLRALAQFLLVIVNNSDVNKMTVRNVGIVFAPTLNIPAPVFSMFLTDFHSIFDELPDGISNSVELAIDRSLSPEDVRSPRHQMFSDIPTPAYNQTSFRNSDAVADHEPQNSNNQHETGFISMQQSYEQPSYKLENGDPNTAPFSMNRMLTPHIDNSRSAKAKRRESSLLFMDAGHRSPSIPQFRDDHALVAEESAFE